VPLIGSQRSALSNMSETFGRPFSLLWLVRPLLPSQDGVIAPHSTGCPRLPCQVPTEVRFHGLTFRDMLAYELEERELHV
jgi:hypothetical protein